MSSLQQQFFFLGATGYIGSQFLESAKRDAALYDKLKEFTLVALVRDPENAKSKQLREVWPGVVLLKGTLDDLSLIEEQARNSALIFNAANADHEPSIKAIVTGLQKGSADHLSGPKPLYIHTSGLGTLSDNSRGEKVPAESLVHHSESKFEMKDFPLTNPHHSPDRIIHAAGAQKENLIRAISVYPGAVYSLGEGITPDALLCRVFSSLYIQIGDFGTAFVKIFKLALEGKAEDDFIRLLASPTPIWDINLDKPLITMSSLQRQFFFLGATGYIGSQFLESAKRDAALYDKLKEFTLVALVRDPENAKSKRLREVWPGIVLVKGTLDDLSLIEEHARNSALTFNAANADHEPSIKAIITGLQKQSADHPSGPKPLYIHTSGLGILSDNSRGEKVSAESLVHYSDAAFKLEDLPPTNPHHSPDTIIHAAGAQKENPIRAISVYPGAVYGLGEGKKLRLDSEKAFIERMNTLLGVTPDALIPRVLGSLYVQTGVAGTWGPGHNALSVIHIKDVGSAFVKIFKLALEGKAEDDYFIADQKAEPLIPKRFAEELGKILHAHDLLKDPEHKPFPEAVTNNFGEIGWSVFGGNFWAISERLSAEGWEPTETAKLSVWDSLPLEVEHFVATYKASRT
ncbi:hypothetical protein H1R20_g7758, partial [Candolleomyces eurysporus]